MSKDKAHTTDRAHVQLIRDPVKCSGPLRAECSGSDLPRDQWCAHCKAQVPLN